MVTLLLPLMLIGGILLVFVLTFGSIVLLIKFGVIAHQASRPTYHDRGMYILNQGREVHPEEHHHETRARDNASRVG